MFAADEPSTLERFTKWAGRASTKGKNIISDVKAIRTAGKDIRSAIKGPTPEQIAADKAALAASYKDEIFGIPSTYVYVGAGLLIAAGIGYIVYNRTSGD